MAERFFIQTYGCQMNEYESAKYADVLSSALS
jgi:tRNA A37 methylthiotransferase MiaB